MDKFYAWCAKWNQRRLNMGRSESVSALNLSTDAQTPKELLKQAERMELAYLSLLHVGPVQSVPTWLSETKVAEEKTNAAWVKWADSVWLDRYDQLV